MRLFGLLRPGNCIMALVGVLVGGLVEVGLLRLMFTSYITEMEPAVGLLTLMFPDTVIRPIFFTLIAAVAAFLVTGAGNALNDYYDRKLDKKAHPERPIPSGRVNPEEAKSFAFGLFLTGIILSLFVNYYCIIIAIVNTGLLFAYESGLKAKGLVGNVTISYLTASVFLFGGASVSMMRFSLVLFLLAFLANIGREIAKDIEDMKADKGHRRTLPMVKGRATAARVAATFVMIAVVLSPLPALDLFLPPGNPLHDLFANRFFSNLAYLAVVLVADVIFIYSSYLVFKKPGEAQSMMKGGMMVAMLAFVMAAFLQFINLWA